MSHDLIPTSFDPFKSDDVVQVLSAKDGGVDVNSLGHAYSTPLHLAAFAGWADVARLLITKGATIDAVDDGRETPLHWAAYAGRSDVARLLIENGAQVNAKNKWHKTPFDLAVARGKDDIVRLLETARNNPALIGHAHRAIAKRQTPRIGSEPIR